jgi:hypothetical protein
MSGAWAEETAVVPQPLLLPHGNFRAADSLHGRPRVTEQVSQERPREAVCLFFLPPFWKHHFHLISPIEAATKALPVLGKEGHGVHLWVEWLSWNLGACFKTTLRLCSFPLYSFLPLLSPAEKPCAHCCCPNPTQSPHYTLHSPSWLSPYAINTHTHTHTWVISVHDHNLPGFWSHRLQFCKTKTNKKPKQSKT